MSEDIVLVAKRPDGLAEVTMNRPHVHNALDDHLIRRLTEVFDALGRDPEVRFVTLTGAGKSFCAGGDIDYLRRCGTYTVEQNYQEGLNLARMLRTIYELPKPVIGLINGPAYGGGLGMTAVCDIAVGVKSASFTLSEVKLGLIPGTISPYVVQAIGARQARRYFLTAERIDALKAKELGLLHEVVDDHEALLVERDRLLAALRLCGPQALADCKALIYAVAERPIDDEVMADSARRIADSRATEQGQEGARAFLEKRKPSWVA